MKTGILARRKKSEMAKLAMRMLAGDLRDRHLQRERSRVQDEETRGSGKRDEKSAKEAPGR